MVAKYRTNDHIRVNAKGSKVHDIISLCACTD